MPKINLRTLIQEEIKQIKKPNIEHYQQVLNQSSISATDKKFYQGVLNTLKTQTTPVTDRQAQILLQIKNGGKY